MSHYETIIQQALAHCLTETQFSFGKKYRGKVRDTYDLGDKLLLITTDRQSAFDRVLASVPFKGQVLNQISAWWFAQTQHIIPNHVLSIPESNVTLAKKCKVFPVEFVVRAYITGTTNTSLWTQYEQGVRQYCGHTIPDGLQKNQKLTQPLLTPTTKDAVHDRLISREEILDEQLMTASEWEKAETAALRLFHYGQQVAANHQLILVDTKYEMGLDSEGNVTLVDEIHTPDSSRYWLKDSYLTCFSQGLEPQNIDKEFLRLWFIAHCDPYHDEILPTPPEALIITLAQRYIALYETIVGEKFSFSAYETNLQRWQENLEKKIGMMKSLA